MDTLPVEEFAKPDTDLESPIVHEVVRALRGLRFGSIVLTGHDGHVVEIHRTEKVRRKGTKEF